MALTRKDIRRAVAFVVDDSYRLGTSQGSSPSNVVVPEAADNGLDTGSYRNHWLWLPASAVADQERRVASWTPSNGNFGVNRNLSVAPTNGAEVEVHRYRPSLYNQAINDGLARMTYPQDVEITPVANTNVYDLSAYHYIRSRRDLFGVFFKLTSGSYEGIEPVPWTRVQFDGTTRELVIDPPLYAVSNQKILLVVKRRFGPLTDETTTVDLSGGLEEQWVRAAAKFYLFKHLEAQTGSGKEFARYRTQAQAARGEYRRLNQMLQARMARRYEFETPHRWDEEIGGHRGWV